MSNPQPPSITLPFRSNPALYLAPPSDVELTLIESRARNPRQLTLLQGLGLTTSAGALQTDPLVHQCGLYEVKLADPPITSINGEPAFQSHLYLFNVIIALEWDPAPATLQQVRLMAQRASDFLYDVTDGYMAFGQVIIGGPRLMNAADLQVMCSNRFHPRTWIDALNDEAKFLPIRVGRGMWQKNHETLATWDSPEGYRALAHEWGHYAYGLVDTYLSSIYVKAAPAAPQDPRIWQQQADITADCITMAAPDIAIAVDSLMTNPQISEYAPIDQIFERITKRYDHVVRSGPPLDGPAELPLPLPLFPNMSDPGDPRPSAPDASADRESLFLTKTHFQMAFPNVPDTITAAVSHWVYLLKPAAAATDAPERVIAQGKISQRDFEKRGFPVLGAAPGDEVVLISQRDQSGSVQRARIVNAKNALDLSSWEDVTPDELRQLDPANPLFVDIVPAPLQDPSGPVQAMVSVQVAAQQQPDVVRLYPSGQPDGARGGIDVRWDKSSGRSDFVDALHLDGAAFLRWEDPAGERILICSYSQGGGPGTSTGGRFPYDGGVPISGGSAEGGAMLFFLDNAPKERSIDGTTTPRFDTDKHPDEGIRVVTTTLTLGSPVRDASQAERARSYIFCLASNASLRPYPATLALTIDDQAPQRGGDLLIYRWLAGSGWQRLVTFIPGELPYVAVPIQADAGDAAPALLSETPAGPRVERFRVFWTPD